MGSNGLSYLSYFPLELSKSIKTLSGMNCFHLIWLECCVNHKFSEVTVSKKDREKINFPWRSYIRGLQELEKAALIMVNRKAGRSCRVSVNTDLLDQKTKDFILNVRGR
jgi:hypothetical protein